MFKGCCGVLFLFLTMHAFALEAPASGFSGQWFLDKNSSADISTAVENCVSHTSFFIRSLTRKRLLKTNTMHYKLVIALGASVASITYGSNGAKPVEAPIDGRSVPWQREDGEKLQVSHQFVSGKLVETFQGEDGQKKITFSLSHDGDELTMAVKVSSPRLPEPLVYLQVYLRADSVKQE